MHDSAIIHVVWQQRFKTNDHCVSRFEMIWCGDVKSIQNHSFKERYLAKFIFLQKQNGCLIWGTWIYLHIDFIAGQKVHTPDLDYMKEKITR